MWKNNFLIILIDEDYDIYVVVRRSLLFVDIENFLYFFYVFLVLVKIFFF